MRDDDLKAMGEAMMRGYTPDEDGATDINKGVVDKLRWLHEAYCFEEGYHPNEEESPYSLGADAIAVSATQSARIAELEAALMQCKENAGGSSMMPTSIIHALVDSALFPTTTGDNNDD